MQTYLILSPAYYGNIDSHAMYRISTKLQNICKKLETKNMRLDFAAFRYNNCEKLNTHEYCMLLEFIAFCSHAKITPLLNLSSYKIEVLLLLWLHGFQIGIHFKESDMPLLRSNAGKELSLSLSMQPYSINLRDNLEIIYNKLIHTNPNVAKIIEQLIINKIYLESFITPLQNAINIFSKTSCYANQYLMQSIDNADKRFCIFVSTHSASDLEEMLLYGINYATISPIFYDKGNKALGLNYLQNMPSKLKSISFALGGIHSDLYVKQISNFGLCGFASISYFLNI